MTHAKSSRLRAEMAEAGRRGQLPTAVAQRNHVSISSVRLACAIHGVQCPVTRVERPIQVLAALFDDTQSIEQIAAHFGLGPLRVYQIFQAGHEAGIPGLPLRTLDT